MKMDEDTLQNIVADELTQAVSYVDEEIGRERARATDYYRGQPFGDEEDGRSQVVSMDVRDTVQAIMPSLMRIFFGPEQVVEFAPQGPEDEALAQQATDYVNYIFQRDNPGFLITHAVLKDALVRRTGIAKWWWDESEETTKETYENVTEEQIAMLMADDSIEIVEVEQSDIDTPQGQAPMGAMR